MTDPKEKKPPIRTRAPGKLSTGGMFDRVKLRNESHPIEEILSASNSAPVLPTVPDPPTVPDVHTVRDVPTAPERDFAKVANSIVRDAVAGGYFRGKSKQIYDYLYARTRGAIVPVRKISIAKPALMSGSGIGAEKTLLKNIAHLKSIGLIEVTYTDGSHAGNIYEVFLPEEIGLPALSLPPIVPTVRVPRDVRSNLPPVPPVETTVRYVGSESLESTSYVGSKTSYKTNTEIDDDALADLVSKLKETAREITGKETSTAERKRWAELADVLAVELKIAAARTTVSSVPAFLTEHLKRRLWKREKGKGDIETGMVSAPEPTDSQLTLEEVKACTDCGGTGFYYPEGYEGGVAKCRHEKLAK